MAEAQEAKERVSVVWMHRLECTCCSEIFIRSAHPLVKDVVLSMISLGPSGGGDPRGDEGHIQGQIHSRRRRNPPLNEDGMFCIDGGRPFVEKLKWMAEDALAIIAWGPCASWGCVQAAKPNPTQATPIDKVILDKPIIKVPGCPPIAEVMTGVVTYITTFGKLPELDRPKMFYSQRIQNKSYRRPHFRCRPIRRAMGRRWCS